MIDLTGLGTPRDDHLADLSIAVTTPLGLSRQEIEQLVQEAMTRMADDFDLT